MMNHPLQKFLYCPKCGSKSFIINNDKSRSCTECGFIYYFNSSAATVAVSYLFSVPNIYVYSNFEVHTLDVFYMCKVYDFSMMKANDDVSELIFIKKNELNPSDFGLISIRKAIEKLQNIIL